MHTPLHIMYKLLYILLWLTSVNHCHIEHHGSEFCKNKREFIEKTKKDCFNEMYATDKHVCMLNESVRLHVHPTATFCRRQWTKLTRLTLPSEWHCGTALYIRSLKQLRMECERHSKIAWYVWHPYSPIKYYWDCIQLLFTFAAFIYMPFQVFYPCPNHYDPFILFTDALAFLHVCSRFVTGYVDAKNKTIVLEPKRIAIHYLKTHFIINLIGALPLQIKPPFDHCEYPSHTALYVVKLLRVLPTRVQWKNVTCQFQLSYIKYVALKVTIISIMFFHWMTYVHFQVPNLCYHIYTLDNKAFAEWLPGFHIQTYPGSRLFNIYQKYTTNLYLVCGLCIGAGYYTPLEQQFLPGFALSSCMGLAGLVFETYAFSELLRLTIYWQFDTYLFQGKYRELEENMSLMRLPWFLQKKIRLFLNYKFNGHYFNEVEIQHTINQQIKQDINLHCCRGLVMNVPMFQDMPVAVINSIVFNLKRVLFMPGEVIVKFGLPGESIHLISSGTVAVMNGVGREVAHLRDGAFFGENALLHPGVLRTATIIALEITEIYMMDNKEFAVCLQPYPHLKRMMEASHTNKRAAILKHAAGQRKRRRP